MENILRMCAAASAASTFTIITLYIMFPHIRNRSAKLIIWLAVSNLVLSLSVLVFVLAPGDTLSARKYVNAFAFLINFQLIANVLWNCAISRTMALVILQRDRLFRMLSSNPLTAKRMGLTRMARFHLLIWISALVVSLIPWFCEAYESYE
jgi:hypothetical protein